MGRDFSQGRGYSEEIAGQIDSEIRDMLDRAFESDRVCLQEHMEDLHRLAAVLLEREKIDGDEFVRVMKGETLPPLSHKEEKPQPPASTADEDTVQLDEVARQVRQMTAYAAQDQTSAEDEADGFVPLVPGEAPPPPTQSDVPDEGQDQP